jgi:hypothetical protein
MLASLLNIVLCRPCANGRNMAPHTRRRYRELQQSGAQDRSCICAWHAYCTLENWGGTSEGTV